ncbi:regulatory protein SipA [Leptolyngbya iicbica]|uniref:DUF3148 domain-containing protein n=3 Tax=Cyanophyceae TaxID=3028117 RepID=A0A4Q7EHI5_9CYAN|nr:DUF3148 domain-containing protein [Leptolyngbya sp. LK]
MSESFIIGDRVYLATAPPYLKTADTMPMLRPGDTVPVGTQGVILQQKPGDYWAVKFEQGAFLVDTSYLKKVVYESKPAAEE